MFQKSAFIKAAFCLFYRKRTRGEHTLRDDKLFQVGTFGSPGQGRDTSGPECPVASMMPASRHSAIRSSVDDRGFPVPSSTGIPVFPFLCRSKSASMVGSQMQRQYAPASSERQRSTAVRLSFCPWQKLRTMPPNTSMPGRRRESRNASLCVGQLLPMRRTPRHPSALYCSSSESLSVPHQ